METGRASIVESFHTAPTPAGPASLTNRDAGAQVGARSQGPRNSDPAFGCVRSTTSHVPAGGLELNVAPCALVACPAVQAFFSAL